MQINGISQRILEQAVMYLTQWENKNISLDNCLDHLRQKGNAAEKSAVASLLFEYFRHKSFIDGLIQKYAKKGIPQEIRLLLCCAATQIFFQTGISRQSAVNVAVDQAKHLRGKSCGGFVNAMLRSMLRDTDFDPDHIPPSFPENLKKRWQEKFPAEQLQMLLTHYASNPPLTFRGRIPLSAPQLQEWHAEKIRDCDFTGDFHFYQTQNQHLLFKNANWQEKHVYIQDPATSVPFSLLDSAVPSGKILDACSAPGGKTILLHDLCSSQNTEIQITAADRSEARLQQLRENLAQAGIRADIVQADAKNPPFESESFDWILADVPCSNTGVIRRRPDAPWHFSEKRLREIVMLQKDILDSLQTCLRPGGFLLYSTCSIESEENDLQIQNFLQRHSVFTLKKQRLLLPAANHDGAFAALLQKR